MLSAMFTVVSSPFPSNNVCMLATHPWNTRNNSTPGFGEHRNIKSVITLGGSDSHLCVMIGASGALSQSQHIGVSHYHPA